MKATIYKAFILGLTVSALLTVSCSKDAGTVLVNAPTVSPTVSVVASCDGGRYSVSYTISNPTDDGSVSSAADVGWISDLDCSSSGTVSFTVAANSDESSRTGNISVSYSYSVGGKTVYATGNSAVIQYGTGSPDLSVQPNAVTADYEGGSYSLSYSVDNPDAEGKLACIADVNWIEDIDLETYGTVKFTVDGNDGEDLRTGTITLTYTYGYNVISKYVTVIQDHVAGGADVSELVGTYTAHGTVYGSGISPATEMDWTVKIYAYTGYEKYDMYIDGLVPWAEGSYDTLGTHDYSASATYEDGQIVIPSQTTGGILNTTSGDSYYYGYTPCVQYNSSNGNYGYSKLFPDLVFSPSGGTWTANYGLFMAGFSSEDVETFVAFYQVVSPVTSFTLTKTSSSTETN